MKKINRLIIDSTNSKTELCELGIKYPTDKTPYASPFDRQPDIHRHPYTSIYNLIFSNLKYKEIKIAEIGVLFGNSLKCWRDYFKNAKLFGFEYETHYLNESKNHNLPNTTIDFINVKSVDSLNETFNKYGMFDIIIDDSTHTFEDQVSICKTLHKFLNPGGILVIEDIFRNIDESSFLESINESFEYYSDYMFIMAEHELRYSPGWDNDKLLVLFKNDKY
jgi:predicted O-methyltransferase YrrM